MIRLTHEAIDYTALSESVRRPGCGAVVLFLGTVRDLTGETVTVALDYEAYPPMAERVMHQIAEQTQARWPVAALAMVHRLGRLAVGEVSVAVAVACPHRAEAFAACQFAIDQLKQLVPIWKRENFADGSTAWVHPHVQPNVQPGSTQQEPTDQHAHQEREGQAQDDGHTHHRR